MARKPTRRECFEKAAPHLARLMLADAQQSTQSSDASSKDRSGGPAAPASPSDPEAA